MNVIINTLWAHLLNGLITSGMINRLVAFDGVGVVSFVGDQEGPGHLGITRTTTLRCTAVHSSEQKKRLFSNSLKSGSATRVQVMRMRETGEGWIGDCCAPVVLSQKHVGLRVFQCILRSINVCNGETVGKESPFGRRG